jgi:hypothetical protein
MKERNILVFLENIFWVNFSSIFKPIIGPLDELQVCKKKSLKKKRLNNG